MGVFYIDTEFTNGNFYLGDIFEIACLSEDSGYIFHSYINIGYKIPNYVKRLCDVTDEKIKSCPSFYNVMTELINFISMEERHAPTKIVAHGGYLSDFPLLLANCMKENFDYTWFKKCEFIDSVKELQRHGYKRPGLDSLSSSPNRVHSAVRDVELLREIATKLLPQTLNIYTLRDIEQYMQIKMPISIAELRNLAADTSRHLEAVLYELAVEKTALSKKQAWKIARYYSRR